MKAWIDLHIHSTASDGTRSPGQIIHDALAYQEENPGPVYLALTDHDTVSGIDEFLEEAQKYPGRIQAVGGIEFSTYYLEETIHILGYGIDRHHDKLLSSLAGYRGDRDSRNERIIEKLRENGFEISMDDIKPLKDGDAIGRPAIARHLLKMNYVSSIQEAFDKYIGDGKPCAAPRTKPSMKEVVDLIHQSGGLAVLAHPVLYKKLAASQLEDMVVELKAIGLDGLEVYYSKNTENDTERYRDMAKNYGLFATGGSDFHGSVKPDISLFLGKGNLRVPDSILPELLERIF